MIFHIGVKALQRGGGGRSQGQECSREGKDRIVTAARVTHEVVTHTREKTDKHEFKQRVCCAWFLDLTLEGGAQASGGQASAW